MLARIMSENGRRGIRRGDGESISAAAGPVDLEEARFPHPERRSRWHSCFGGLSCLGSQKGRKRVVPASRVPEASAAGNHGNGSQAVVHSIQATTLSLLAPPSSPASFINSALPSTAQSPRFLTTSMNSPVCPSSTMFVTGPYAHETQLVSPPVFSTYTTEPSTAPLTPPPELAHLTTPSSPEVPYARFLTSSLELKGAGKVNGAPFLPPGYVENSDIHVTYPLYPGSPSSSLISPASGTPRTGVSSPYPEPEFPNQWGASFSARSSPNSMHGLSRMFGLSLASSKNFVLPSEESSFFSPASSAQFYLDQSQRSAPAEEVEAYRASFGFSADEIIATRKYVEISSDGHDVSFTMSPFLCNKQRIDSWQAESLLADLKDPESPKMTTHPFITVLRSKAAATDPYGTCQPDSPTPSGGTDSNSKVQDVPLGGDEVC